MYSFTPTSRQLRGRNLWRALRVMLRLSSRRRSRHPLRRLVRRAPPLLRSLSLRLLSRRVLRVPLPQLLHPLVRIHLFSHPHVFLVRHVQLQPQPSQDASLSQVNPVTYPSRSPRTRSSPAFSPTARPTSRPSRPRLRFTPRRSRSSTARALAPDDVPECIFMLSFIKSLYSSAVAFIPVCRFRDEARSISIDRSID